MEKEKYDYVLKNIVIKVKKGVKKVKQSNV